LSKANIVFDLDGTIANSEPAHFRAAKEIFAELGFDIGNQHDYLARFAGMSSSFIFPVLVKENNLDADLEEMLQKKRELTKLYLSTGTLSPVPGVVEFIQDCRKSGCKIGIASGTSLENIKITINKLGIEDLFDCLASARETNTVKPDPAVFLLAAKRINVDPTSCIVFEDATAGIEGAKKAGMRSIALTTSVSRWTMEQLEPDYIMDNFLDFNFETCKNKLGLS